MTEENIYEDGKFYWVQEYRDGGWSIMQFGNGKWTACGIGKQWEPHQIHEVGHEAKMVDAKARSQLRSLMTDIDDMHGSNEDYGPFCNFEETSSGAIISWGNLTWHQNEYKKIEE
jgi:hypothetical protein